MIVTQHLHRRSSGAISVRSNEAQSAKNVKAETVKMQKKEIESLSLTAI